MDYLMLAHLCMPFESQPEFLGWNRRCSRECKLANVDAQFTCFSGRKEHGLFPEVKQRAENLSKSVGAKEIFYVTTLRRGSDRLLSEFLYNVNSGGWSADEGFCEEDYESCSHRNITEISNETLQVYLDEISTFWPGGNLQIAFLLSEGRSDLINRFGKSPMTEEHLRSTQRVLTKGNWMIGFADCMAGMSKKP